MHILNYFITVVLTLCSVLNVSRSVPCKFHNGKYDLSALDRPTGWPVSIPMTNGSVSHYEISLCHPLNYSSLSSSDCSNSSVCLISGNITVSYGSALEDAKDYAIADNIGTGFTLYVLTSKMCNDKGLYRSTINFICGPHLGAPELISNGDCQVHFMWRTSAACHSRPKKEVPCYVLDEQGYKRDLTPLIKDKGGYYVNTPNPAYDFVINVCAELDDSQSKCPPNISSCRINEDNRYSFGSLFNELQYVPEGLYLTYTNDNLSSVPPECQLKPKTTILFKCPSRGFSQPPKLISTFNCQYEVEWETEYACPENILKGDIKKCQFTRESHGVEIDLSPLRSATWYNVSSNTSSVKFALNICGGLGDNYTCSGKHWKSISVCVLNSTSGVSRVGGKTFSSELSYVDGQVMLKYLKGDTCDDGEEETTVINFICDPEAVNNGIGEPIHMFSGNCSHIFQWYTKYVCLNHSLDTPCSVTYNKKTVSLQKLLITKGEAWEAVDLQNLKGNKEAEFYINVCGQVSHLGNLSSCGEGSSVCVFDNGKFINLGNFTSPPIYDELSNSVWLHYTEGSHCKEGKLWHSSVEFICKPGRISSEPILVRYDENECHYVFEWHTAEACPTGLIEGSNCKVFSDDLHINFDLTPLKSIVYKVESNPYEFYIGVCEPIKKTPCSEKNGNSENVGVCQVDKVHNNSWKTGEPTSRLSYTDGVVSLTYLSGDPYNNQNKTSRMTMIIFMCDYKAGNGNPLFIEEVNYAYIFHWYTDLVCLHLASPECIVHDPVNHFIYDLSELSISKQDYRAVIREGDKERLIYLSVCQPLSRINICNSGAAACIVEKGDDDKEKVVISNLGKSVKPPVFESSGHLSLMYTHGDPCVAFGQNTTYSTLIHFLCASDETSETGLRYLSKVGACEYSFLWSTKAACPTKNLLSLEKCELTDPVTGFTYDLTTLYKAKEPYTITSPEGNFQLNICGRILNGCLTSDGKEPAKNISVCKVDNENNLISNIAVADAYTLNYSPNKDLTIVYKSENNQQEVVIRFPCFDNTTDPDPKLIHQDDKQLVFEVKTPLTCITSHFNCNIIAKDGKEYNLNPLAKYSGNWEVPDSTRSGLKYHINFCRPLTKLPTYNCPGGESSSCQTDSNHPEAVGHDLGSQMEEPKVSDKGTIVLRYTGGSYCHNGQFRRSTTINLFCSDTIGNLIFLGETEECEYVFSLDTSAACPLESSTGHNCLAQDHVYGYMFDLNPLKSKNSSYNVTVGEYNYVFNVCDKLSGFDNECANSSACQLKQNDAKFARSLGLPNDVLVYYKGLITLEYRSGSGDCHGMYNRSTKITFTCHHAHEDKDGPIFIAEAQDCTYLFEWPTVHACPPFDVIECSVVDENGVFYDLSHLSLPNDNYYVKYPSSDKIFVINVCRSIVHSPNSLCSYTSGACLIGSDSNEPINLGRVNKPPYIENGKIKISYSSGDMCREEGASKFMQTIIEFNCDPSLLDSEPIFVGKDGCIYYFEWNTAYACTTSLVNSSSDCFVKNPITGYLFNLSSLKNQGPFKFSSEDHEYYLNVCADSKSSVCGAQAGMCQIEKAGQKRHWLGGKVNSNLTYNEGVLFLNYTDGDDCHSKRFSRNTIIEFHCGPGIGEPQLLFESHECTYFFSWTTELACESLIHCAVKNGSLYYDLTTLSGTYYTAASSVPEDNASYYISLCSSLPSIPDVYCPPGSSICRVHENDNGSSVVSESLGKVSQSLIDFMGHATVLYINGSACNRSPKDKNSARILFDCDVDAGMGEPVLIDKTDCLYLFLWKTSLVCPEKPEKSLFSSCNYTDSSRGIYFNLLPLQRIEGQPNYEVTEQNTSFQINICGTLNSSDAKCKDAGVCSKIGNEYLSYGVAKSQKFTYDGRRLRLTFYKGDDCPSGANSTRMSEIFFVCDPSAGMGLPILHKKYTCLAVFMWKTSVVCNNIQHKCAFDDNGKHYDFNMLSSLSHNWIASSIDNNMYWINLCRGIQLAEDTLGCSPSAAVCMKSKDDYINLGMVQTMQFKTFNSSTIKLTFTDGDARACSSLHSSSLHPTTRIFMQCGSSLGQPRITSGPDDKCYYDFTWETYLACPNFAQEVLMEEDGIIKDTKKNLTFDIRDILNRTYVVLGNSVKDHYTYQINLSGFESPNSNFSSKSSCAKAAICQTKPGSDFQRDIGSFSTRKFILRGNELHLAFHSLSRPCGKNSSKNVTTIFIMECVSASGADSPNFFYESGDCDYIFEWKTNAVCTDFHRRGHGKNEPKTDPYHEPAPSGGKSSLVVGIIFAVIAAGIILFIVIKAERRAFISSRIRNLFGRVSLPYFQYKRGDILTELQSDF